MPNVGKCQLHVPHKANMDDWAVMLGRELFPDNPVKAASLANLARADKENWTALERFLNDVAPDCFGGGTGCGVPGPKVGTTPIADGEDSCAEGDGTESHGDRSVTMGLRNIIDAFDPNSVIVGGQDNNIQNGNGVGNNVILGGINNIIDFSDECVVGGSNNLINGYTNCFAFGSDHIINLVNNGTAFGADNQINEGCDSSFVEGFGSVAWSSYMHAYASSLRNDDLQRSYGQGSFLSWETGALASPISMNGLTFGDLVYGAIIEGAVIAVNTVADVQASWTFKAHFATDGAGGARFVGVPVVTPEFADAGAALWTVSIIQETINFTNDTFNIQVTGDATDPTNWTATLRLTEALGGF